MKKTVDIFILLLLVIVWVGGCGEEGNGSGTSRESSVGVMEFSADEVRRHEEGAGGYSFIPPDGWQIREMPGLKYKIAAGKPIEDFAPNINVVDETFSGTLEEYRERNIQGLRQMIQGFKLLKTETLTTDLGQEVVKLDCENEQIGRRLRQILYLTANDDRKYVITCSVLQDNSDGYELLFDAVVKTFRVE